MSHRFSIRAKELWLTSGDKDGPATLVGPTTALYVYHQECPFRGSPKHEEVDVRNGIIHRNTDPRIDVMFTAGDRVVGIESKQASDLLSSWASRRLARQVKALMQAVDIPCLMVRHHWPWEDQRPLHRGEVPLVLYQDLVGLQMQGVWVLPGPLEDEELLSYLCGYKDFFTRPAAQRRCMAGTDRKRKV